MMIVLRSGSGRHVLRGARSRLGRSPQCELSIPGGTDSVVSWEHASLEVAAGLVVVSDLGSTNGTFVNGQRLEPNRRVSVAAGDRIRFGMKGPEFLVESIDLAPPPAPAQLYPPPAPPPPLPPPPPFERHEEPRPRPTIQARRTSGPTNTQLHRAVDQLHGQGRAIIVVAVVGVVVCLVAVGVIGGLSYLNAKRVDVTSTTREEDPPPPPPPTESERYDRLMKSAAWIETYRKVGEKLFVGRGSGCLIESKGELLILTAAHVVLDADAIVVAFPRRNAAGDDWEYNPQVYRDRKWQFPAEVVKLERGVDLAVLKLKTIPDGVVPLKLSSRSPKVASACVTIGNQAPEGEVVTAGLWAFKPGRVTLIDYKRKKLEGLGPVQAWMIQTDIVINQGDSGGPLLNENDEVIGVNSNGRLELEGGNLYNFQIERRVIDAFVSGKPYPGPQ